MSGEYRELLLEHADEWAEPDEVFNEELRDALEFLVEVLQGPRTSPQPELTAEHWHTMACRDGAKVPESEAELYTDHRCCRCVHCRWWARNWPIVSEWRVSQDKRPHRLYVHPYGSVSAALAELQRPEAGLRSKMGSLMSRQKEIESLGTVVQTTERFDRDPHEVRRIDLKIDVQRCVAHACSRDDVRGEVSTGAAVLLTVASAADEYRPEDHVEEYGVSTATVRGIVSRARKRVTVELAARELIPEPRVRVGLANEINERRRQLAQGVGA